MGRIAGSAVARVAFNMRPTSSPWGGGNQWLQQMIRALTGRGYQVVFDLKGPVDAVVLVDGVGRRELTRVLPDVQKLFDAALTITSHQIGIYDLAYLLMAEDVA